jgi:hypothetical protein
VTFAGGTVKKAFIDILEIPGSTVFSDPDVGTYHRPLLPGIYTVIVSAYGYHNDTIRNVVVTDSGAARVDATLQLATDIAHPVPELPAQYSLDQNFPNPFNPSTTIRYSLPERSTVRLTLRNVLGQTVAEIINETKDDGTYEQTFNADHLSSGMYFYRIEAESVQNTGKLFVETKKMILVR